MEIVLLLFLATWLCGAAVFWFFWRMTKPWRFTPRLLLLSLIAAIFIAPSVIFSHGAAPVPAIILLIGEPWGDQLWGAISVAVTWVVILAFLGRNVNKRSRKWRFVIGILAISALVVATALVRFPPRPRPLCHRIIDGAFQQWALETGSTNS